ncbi:MAG: hypothetical protein ACI81V_000064 [Lentimonas sp.]|jgi:hypothetical protein
MSISIYYRGSIDSIHAIPLFVKEVSGIAQSMKWESMEVAHDESNHLFTGIILTPPGRCEPLTFIFDAQGCLRSFADLITKQDAPDSHYSLLCSTKTQNHSVGIHMRIVNLLRHLKQNYLNNLKVTDESTFWKSGHFILPTPAENSHNVRAEADDETNEPELDAAALARLSQSIEAEFKTYPHSSPEHRSSK